MDNQFTIALVVFGCFVAYEVVSWTVEWIFADKNSKPTFSLAYVGIGVVFSIALIILNSFEYNILMFGFIIAAIAFMFIRRLIRSFQKRNA